MTDLHPLDLADQRNNPDALDPRPIRDVLVATWDRLKRPIYYVLIAHTAIWCAAQLYLTVSYVQERAAFVGGW